MTSVSGACLCGSVEVRANVESTVGACHCDICRTWGGGPLFALDGGDDVSFAGAEHVRTHATSDWAERGFCAQCGTHLFIRVNQTGRYILPAGLFDRVLADIVFDHQIFVDKRPGYYRFANTTAEQTGAEVFAQFSPDTSG